MVDKSNAYDLVIADLRRQRAEIDTMIAKLEAMAGGQPIPPAEAAEASAINPDASQSSQEENNPYLGMSVADATVALLKKTRKAMSPVEIVKELEAGGLLLSASNKPATIGTLLARRQKRVGDLVRPKRGQWGLKEWYPGRTFGKSDAVEKNNSKDEEATSQATVPSEPEQPSEPPQSDPEDPEAGL